MRSVTKMKGIGWYRPSAFWAWKRGDFIGVLLFASDTGDVLPFAGWVRYRVISFFDYRKLATPAS